MEKRPVLNKAAFCCLQIHNQQETNINNTEAEYQAEMEKEIMKTGKTQANNIHSIVAYSVY